MRDNTLSIILLSVCRLLLTSIGQRRGVASSSKPTRWLCPLYQCMSGSAAFGFHPLHQGRVGGDTTNQAGEQEAALRACSSAGRLEGLISWPSEVVRETLVRAPELQVLSPSTRSRVFSCYAWITNTSQTLQFQDGFPCLPKVSTQTLQRCCDNVNLCQK